MGRNFLKTLGRRRHSKNRHGQSVALQLIFAVLRTFKIWKCYKFRIKFMSERTIWWKNDPIALKQCYIWQNEARTERLRATVLKDIVCNLLIFQLIFNIWSTSWKFGTGGDPRTDLPNGNSISVTNNIIDNIYYHGIVVANIWLNDTMKTSPVVVANNRLRFI